MCGIVGHIASQALQRPREVVTRGLACLEYRGYNSTGIVLETSGDAEAIRAVGKPSNLAGALEAADPASTIAVVGHTCWTTHGWPTVQNVHLHPMPDHYFFLVHNDIIKNVGSLCTKLASQGVHFFSDTNTEVIAHLLQRAFDSEDLEPREGLIEGLESGEPRAAHRPVVAIRRVIEDLEETFTLLILCANTPGTITAACHSSPLIVGLGQDENFLSSDALAFVEHTSCALEINQGQQVFVTVKGVTIVGHDASVMPHKEFEIDFASDRVTKGGWATFMKKEIHEQPRGVADALAGRPDSHGHLALGEVRILKHVLRGVDRVIMTGCDTASYTGQVAHYAIEHQCRTPVEVGLSPRFCYHDPIITEKTLVVTISQSDEIMDMIQVIHHMHEQGTRIATIVNIPGSTTSREPDVASLTHAGPEITVASTKAFASQMTTCYTSGLYLAQARGNKYTEGIADYIDKPFEAPAKIQEALDRGKTVREFVRAMADMTSVIYLGYHAGFSVALESVPKLKRICYIHTEGFAAGELKHGPIALVGEGQPVIIIVPTPRRPELHNKVLANIQEAHAHGARATIIAEEGDTLIDAFAEVVFRVPPIPTLYTPLFAVVPLQILTCELAITKGLGIGQPRNLAKFVTVEQTSFDAGGLPTPMQGDRFTFGG